MQSKFLLALTLAGFLVVLGTAHFMQAAPAAVVSTIGTSQTTTSSMSNSSGYTMAEVAQHNTASSCWTAINGNVYDLTNWIDQHPGGPGPILSLCGTDGSAAFNAQHGGESRPEQELANFLLGPLS